MDVRRFGAQYRSRRLTLERTHEVYRTYYDLRYPNQEREEGRRLRLSPAYPGSASSGPRSARSRAWERPNWFEPNAAAGDEGRRPRGFAGRHWSPAIEAEHVATRERAGLFDETSFSKLEVVGPGALGLLQRLCGNDVDKPVGSVVYTSMLNARGGIECDFTVTRLGPSRFRIVTGAPSAPTTAASSSGTCPRTARPRSSTSPGLLLHRPLGPRARDILAATTTADVSNAGFPYLTARESRSGACPRCGARDLRGGARLGDVRAHGVRAGAVGHPVGGGAASRAGRRRLPRHRHPPPREGLPVLERRHHSRRHPAGGRARVRGQAGEGEFPGPEALVRQRAEGVRRELARRTLSDPAWVALGGEPVRVADRWWGG